VIENQASPRKTSKSSLAYRCLETAINTESSVARKKKEGDESFRHYSENCRETRPGKGENDWTMAIAGGGKAGGGVGESMEQIDPPGILPAFCRLPSIDSFTATSSIIFGPVRSPARFLRVTETNSGQ